MSNTYPLTSLLSGWYTIASDTDFHRPFTWDAQNLAGLGLGFLVAAFAFSAGVGGGAFFVPLFNLVLGFGIKAAGSCSQAAIFGGSVASVLVNLMRPHPQDTSRPLVDVNLALILTPPLLIGVDVGVLVNTVLPDWLIALGLVLLLSFMSTRTLQKGRTMWRKESQALETKHQQLEQQAQPIAAGQQTEEGSEAAAKPAPPCIVYPVMKLLEMAALWVVFLTITLVNQRFGRCSWQFTVGLAVEVLLCVSATAAFMHQVISEAEQPVEDGTMEPLLAVESESISLRRGDSVVALKYTRSVLLSSAAGTVVSGAIAGLLGLGGGMLFTPLLLEYGIPPDVASATANMLILFCSSCATVTWGIQGLLNLQYAAVYFVLCMVAACVGLFIIGGFVRKSGRTSLLVLLLGSIMGGGAALTVIFGGWAAWRQLAEGHLDGFKPWC